MFDNRDDEQYTSETLDEEGLVENVCASTKTVSHDLVIELLRRSADEPDDLIGHLGDLIAACNADADTPDWAAAAAIGNILNRHPSAAAPYGKQLIEAIDHDSEYVRESISSGLTNAVSEVEIPIDQLLSYLERDDAIITQVIEVLGAIAVEQPDRLPIDRLETLAESGEEVTAVGAQYILILLAATDRCGPPYEPDLSGHYQLTQDMETINQDRSLEFLVNRLRRKSIDEYLTNRVAAAGYQDMRVATTPNGTQIILKVEEPSQITDSDGLGVQNLTTDLQERFGLENVQIDLQQVSQQVCESRKQEDNLDQTRARGTNDMFGSSDDKNDEPSETKQRVKTIVDTLQSGQIEHSEVIQRLGGSIEERPIAARVLVRAALYDPEAVEGIVQEATDRLAERELARPIAEDLLVSAEAFRTSGINYATVAEGSLDALEEALRRIETVRTGRAEEVLGGGASEIILAAELRDYADSVEGRQQLVIEATADAFEAVPKALARQADMDPIDTLVEMRSKHQTGTTLGISTTEGELRDAGEFAADEMELRARLTDGVALAGIVALTLGTVTQLGTLTGHEPDLD